MGGYLAAMWRCRYFWLSLVKKDLRARYQWSSLGLCWTLARPIAMAVIFCAVFQQVFQIEVRYYVPYLLTGLACWQFIVNATVQGCQCFFHGESYIRQHPAPLAIYPLRTALVTVVFFLTTLGLGVAASWCFNGLGNLPALIALVPGILILFVFCWSLAVLAGFANVFFRDTQHLSDFVFQMLFYATPVLYPRNILRACRLEWLSTYNPLVAFLSLIRDPIAEGRIPSPETFGITMLVTALVAAAAVWTLARQQQRLIFYL